MYKLHKPKAKQIILIQWGAIILIAAFFVAPYLVTRASDAPVPMATMASGMMQKMFALDSAGTPIPTVSFTITQGPPDGWYLHIITSNFTFTPDKINTAPVADEGHAHLYIDGVLTVVLGPYFHIDASAMPPGKHTIMVSLNANDHSVFAFQGKPIETSQTFCTY